MTDRFDEAKRSLEEVPAPDVWAEAERRAAGDGVVPLAAAAAGGGRPPGRWLAVAAAAAVFLAGTVAMVMNDDEAPVNAGSGNATSNDPAAEDVTTYQADGGCKIGIRGEPLPEPSTMAFAAADGSGGTMLVGQLNDTQQYAVHAPGEVVTDLLGERVEDVQLRRGTAQLWFQQVPNDAVQVRWFPGITEEDPCESFTVSVESGSEDENRHAAVDLADRLLVGRELEAATQPHATPSADPLDGTEWQLERATVDGEPVAGTGPRFDFADGRASWNDLCNTFEGDYEIAEGVLSITDISDVTPSVVSCQPSPTSGAIEGLMRASRIDWTIDDRGFLILTAGTTELVLRPPVDEGEADDTGAAYGIWPMTAPESQLGYLPEFRGTAEGIAVAFASEVLEWTDAEIVDTEPSEDGHDGTLFLVRSPEVGRDVEIGVRTGDAPDHQTVYRVDVPLRAAEPDAETQVNRTVNTGRVNVTPVPEGTASSVVRWTYGEYSEEGSLDESIDLSSTGDATDDIPGGVLVLFRNQAGTVIGAWGTAVDAGELLIVE